MTTEQKIKALAELDGWTFIPSHDKQLDDGLVAVPDKWSHVDGDECWDNFPENYLTSYDAILPLIKKKISKDTCHSFFDTLGIEAAKKYDDVDGAYEYQGDGSYFEQWILFNSTPEQLADALLRWTGKWEE